MSEIARAYDVMLLITYCVRDDADARGYEDWLRRVDNPFFNAAGCIAHYSNWKLAPGPNLFAPHTHFDFLGLAKLEDLDAAFNDPELNRFRREWRRLWAVEEETKPGAVIQTCLCTRIAAGATGWTDRIALCPAGTNAPRRPAQDVWQVGKQFRGAPPGFDTFTVTFLAKEEAANDGRSSVATCIAAPE